MIILKKIEPKNIEEVKHLNNLVKKLSHNLLEPAKSAVKLIYIHLTGPTNLPLK